MRILVIGDSCKDVFVYGKADRLCPEAPVPVFIPQRRISNGGMAANVYENIKSLDFPVDLITNDLVVEKTRYVEEKTNHQIIRIDSEYERSPRIKDLDKVQFDQYSAIIISDYNKGFLEYDDIEYICNSHPSVFIDTKKVINDKMLSAKFIKINEYEYRNNILAGQSFVNYQEKLIVTLSGKGCEYQGVLYPVELVEIKDNSGAGDTFISGLVVNYCKTKNIEDSIKYANECATIVVQQKGVNRVGDFLNKT
jgi:D-beta-D-heptose 7-phosphate kinase/D-beta-D-heptose 1-phosphate adenosyltransferase